MSNQWPLGPQDSPSKIISYLAVISRKFIHFLGLKPALSGFQNPELQNAKSENLANLATILRDVRENLKIGNGESELNTFQVTKLRK